MDDANFMAANAVMTGLITGGVRALTGSGSFEKGFLDGAFGGAVSYAGKRLAARTFAGAGLLGRQVSALGVSMARNSARGRRALEEIVLPAYGVRVYWDLEASTLTVRPNLASLYWTMYGLADDNWQLDLGESLSAGSATFLLSNEVAFARDIIGTVQADVIFLSRDASQPIESVRSHESVHVIQLDQMWGLWAEAAERFVSEQLPFPFPRWVDVGILNGVPPWVSQGLLSRGSNPFEVEADYLEVQAYR